VTDPRALAVARRAVELASASGVSLPDDLALWSLAGGRPHARARPGEPEELGELLEQTTAPPARRRLGAHFTPRSLARELVARALAGHRRPSVGDPACGGGALLLAAARHLAAAGEPPGEVAARLWAVDVDPLAVATTEASLALWAGVAPPAGRCREADALQDDLAWPPLDVVVGNPPFLSPLGVATRPSPQASRDRRARYAGAAGAYTDAAALFLLEACRRATAGGTVALLQPISVLSARDAGGVRHAVSTLGTLLDVWIPPAAFDAAVDVCVPIVRVHGAEATPPAGNGPDGWATWLAGANGVPPVALRSRGVLGDVASTIAGFRSEYYGMVDHVREGDLHGDGGARPLVTTGLVDLGGVAWGERRCRVGGRVWDRPVVDATGLDGRAAQWAARTHVPKLLVATQTSVVEVAVDEEGELLPAVPLVVVLAPADRLWPLAAALASPAVTGWLLHRTAGAALTRDALKVSAPILREVPLPADEPAWSQGVEALRAGDLDGFAGSMGDAYGVGPEIGAWWRPRARSVWSPAPASR
jgi:hypothetical protein